MKLDDIKEQIDAYFDAVSSEQIIEDFKNLGYNFVPINNQNIEKDIDQQQTLLAYSYSSLIKTSDYRKISAKSIKGTINLIAPSFLDSELNTDVEIEKRSFAIVA